MVDPTLHAEAMRRLHAFRPLLEAEAHRMGHANTSDDLVQGFLVDVVLQRRLFDHVRRSASAEEEAGYVRRAFHNYVIDLQRRERARAHRESSTNGSVSEPLRSKLDTTWACKVLQGALKETEQYLRSRSLESHWILFDRRIIAPAIRGAEQPAMTEAIEGLDFKDSAQASAALQYVKRTLIAMLGEAMSMQSERPGHEDPVAFIRAILDR